jgi:hypothetical protein
MSHIVMLRVEQQILLVCLYTIPILIKVKESGTPPTYCPYAVVCSTGILELVLLLISKISALLMYPPLAVIMLSKCASLRSFIQTT